MKTDAKIKRILFFALLALAVGLIAVGLSQGGFADVLEKARTVCFECVGIG